MPAVARRTIWALAGLGLLFLAVQDFAWHAMWRGLAGLSGEAEARGRLAGSVSSDAGIFVHMIAGGVVTILAVLQWAGPVRRRWPRLHRMSGRILAPLALLTALGGLLYIMLRGTVGGPMMSVGFAVYGLLMALAAVQTLRLALRRDLERHRRWGLRLVILALGSWIYRLHYGLWYGVTCSLGEALCGIGSQPDFRGAFDLVQNVAFYLPYLLVAELSLRRQRAVHH
ncbi:MAG: DUF2306 domain-containing protein [Pseudomonadota bacterium]